MAFESLYSGFADRANEERQHIRKQEAHRDDQEFSLLQALAASPDPQIRSMAVAGMLNFGDPRAKRKGLAGFLGETQGHPALPAIRNLLQTPVIESDAPTPGLPGQTPGSGQIRTPPAATGAAAGAATSPTQGGPMLIPGPPTNPGGAMLTPPPQPPPTSTGQVVARTPGAQAGLPPPQPGYAPPTQPPVRVRERQAFRTPEEGYRDQARGKAQGDVEGEVAGLIAAGFTDAEARALVKESYAKRAYGAGATGQQSIAGEVPNDAGGYVPAFGAFNRATGQYIDPNTGQPLEGFRPRTTTGSTSLGATREALAREMYGKRASDLSPEQMAQVNAAEVARAGDLSYERGINAGNAANQTKLNAPLDPTAAAIQGLPAGSSLATFQGLVPISVDQRNRIDAAKALAPQIDQMDALIQRVFPPSSGLTGGLTAAGVLAQKKLTRDPEIEQLDALVNLSLGNVARVLAAESGRLTEQDAIRARSALVDLKVSLVSGDTQETAIAKVRVVQDALRRIGQDLRSPGQTLGTEKGIPSPGGQAAPPPSAPQAAPAAGPGAGTPAPPPSMANVATVGQVVYGPDGRRGVVTEVLADGQLRVKWEVK